MLGNPKTIVFTVLKRARREFCSTCGTSLFFDPTDKEKHDWIGIVMGHLIIRLRLGLHSISLSPRKATITRLRLDYCRIKFQMNPSSRTGPREPDLGMGSMKFYSISFFESIAKNKGRIIVVDRNDVHGALKQISVIFICAFGRNDQLGGCIGINV